MKLYLIWLPHVCYMSMLLIALIFTLVIGLSHAMQTAIFGLGGKMIELILQVSKFVELSYFGKSVAFAN